MWLVALHTHTLVIYMALHLIKSVFHLWSCHIPSLCHIMSWILFFNKRIIIPFIMHSDYGERHVYFWRTGNVWSEDDDKSIYTSGHQTKIFKFNVKATPTLLTLSLKFHPSCFTNCFTTLQWLIITPLISMQTRQSWTWDWFKKKLLFWIHLYTHTGR